MTGQPTRSAYVKKAYIKLNRLKEERGSALVLVMFILLLLTILGLSVLSTTVGGAQRTETRKNDVQSLHLAEKTLDEVVAYITSSLNKKIESNIDISQAELDQSIKNFLTALPTTLPAGLKTSTDLANATGKISGITYAVEGTIGTGTLVKYIVTINSEAEVNGVKRNLKQRVFIDTFPDFLKYTIGSEKNLTINGAPLIIGNIYAGDILIISDKAEYTYKKNSIHLYQVPLK